MQTTYNSLLLSSPNIVSRSRLARSESGVWIHTFSMYAIGLRMDDDIVRVAIGLRLGGSLFRPHSCVHCGNQVDHLGHHGLRCRMSQGRHPRHVAINDIIKRALTSAKYSSLSSTHHFIPIAIETLGVFGKEALAFFRDLGNRIKQATGEPQSHNFFLQRLSVVIQRGNAASILGTAWLT